MMSWLFEFEGFERAPGISKAWGKRKPNSAWKENNMCNTAVSLSVCEGGMILAT